MRNNEKIITSIDEARTVLLSDSALMINMEMDGSCWIRKSIKDSKGIPIAEGEFVVEISHNVLEELSQELEQTYCSEFYQKSALTMES
ncbi:hypothetical protein BUE93_22045 [Chromobacterium amazonense]|uniref:Uncharacterized protein n=1 Tax=Chromobacterium amazonense TaxID=1382803 RepID=A0A2S9WYL6_9NEIS|nr:hypothetical protein [Chromobacterium amazonense]PRP68486.1 hypothetical protein BUE93_22045 [Chromobacterium amazonense]